jgi:hypothetical protein
MDFLDPQKKRAHLIRLYVGYALVAIAIGIGTVVILYSSFGYGVDRHTGKVIQNGLVFLSSRPDGATIKLTNKDGKKQPEAKTDTRLTIPASRYSATLSKEGYRDWQRTFDLDGGSVERMTYPLLIPQNLKTTDTQLYNNQPPLITQSPDRKWTVVQKPGSLNEFEVFDDNETDPTPVSRSIPTNLYSAGTGAANQSLHVVEWSTDNRHVLFRHHYNDTFEFILFDHEKPEESINLNHHFNAVPIEVALYDKKVDQVYILTAAGQLSRGNLKDRQNITLLNNIVSFKPHGSDMIEYISRETTPTTGKVTVRLRTNDTEYTLRELPAGTTYLLDLARFDNRWYVVAGAQSENKVYVYENPIDILSSKNSKANIPARTLRVDTPQKASFSANARFVSIQGINQNFTIYDAETDRQYRYVIDKPLDTNHPATWMDGHRLTSVSNNQVIIFDFDGINLQTLSAALPGTSPLFDREYTALYTLSPSVQVNGRFALTRSSLRVDQ